MTLSEELLWRGLIKDKTFEDVTWLDAPRSFYLGADCNSSDSLTIGNLAIFLVARRLAEAGWKTVLLVGGATSLIGDPGGKDEERELKTREEIVANVAGIKRQVSQLFAGHEFELVDNYDWFKDIGYLEFLRDVGKHYSMTELIQRDYISARIGEGGSGISYAEFSYSLIQGYDYWHLYKTHGVELQIGGSDQWGNMLSGAPLIRKKSAQDGQEVEAHALSMPLVINRLTGKKFGKSEHGAVWLDQAKTSPSQFYQFWINSDDDGVEDYLKVYTMLSKDDIEGIMARHREDPSQRIAQSRLALEVTELVHGQAAAEGAQVVTGLLTGVVPVAEADAASLELFRNEQPSYRTTGQGNIVQALTESGLAGSNTEAMRLLKDNAVSINGTKISRDSFEPADFTNGRLLLRKGKKHKDTALVEFFSPICGKPHQQNGILSNNMAKKSTHRSKNKSSKNSSHKKSQPKVPSKLMLVSDSEARKETPDEVPTTNRVSKPVATDTLKKVPNDIAKTVKGTSKVITADQYNDPEHNYLRYWDGRAYEDGAERIALKRMLAGKHFRHAVDIGGGYGRLCIFLEKYADKVTLAEPSQQQLDIAEDFLRNHPRIDRTLMQVERLPFKDGSVDLFTMVRVMHHLPDPKIPFDELARSLSDDGILILEMANYSHFRNKLKHTLKGTRLPEEPVDIRSAENRNADEIPFVNHNPHTVIKQLARAGLKVDQTLSVSNLRSPGLKKVVPRRAMLAIEKILQKPLAGSHFGPSIFFLVRKAK